MAYVYFLRGIRGGKVWYYTGQTDRTLTERLGEHRSGKSPYTRSMSEIQLIAFIQVDSSCRWSVENYCKKNHRFCEYMQDRNNSKKILKHFQDWCKIHGVEIRNIGKFQKELQEKPE